MNNPIVTKIASSLPHFPHGAAVLRGQMREACHHARLTNHVRRHMGTTFSHITSSNRNQIGLQNIHLCDNQTDI